MKLRKTKIAAAAMAAITAISAAQAITASAATYTSVPTRTCEGYEYVNNITTYLSGCYGTKANVKWNSYSFETRKEIWGQTCKTGFQKGNYSGLGHGANVSDGKAFARKVARYVYNTSNFMEMKEVTSSSAYNYFRYIPRIGDQVTVKYGSTLKTIFITKVTNGTIRACEVDENGYIRYNKTYSYKVSNKSFNNSGKAWYFQYVARPIKAGDANGDSYVSLDGDSFFYSSASGSVSFDCKADGAEMSAICYNHFRSNENEGFVKAAADWDGSGEVNGSDYWIFCDHMIDYSGSGLCHDGNTVRDGYVNAL